MSTTADTNHPRSRWEALVNAALLGLDRARLPQELSAAPWRFSNLARESAPEPVTEYLRELAALAIYELAGSEALESDANIALEPSVSSERCCSRTAACHLDEILHGGRLALLAEWCIAARNAAWTAPPELLPSLLEQARNAKNETLRRDATCVAGQRGAWLAAQRAEWKSLFENVHTEEASITWDTSTLAERVAHLRAIRATHASRAHELVSSVWEQESAADRAAMVEQFEVGLTADDEAWLEARLDDRSKQVRGIAAELLARLPTSSFSRRMADRVRQHVRYIAGSGIVFKKQATLEISLSDTLEEAMKRDGLEAKALRGMGPKAVLLSQIVSLAPLELWLAEQPSAVAWIDAALNSEWSRALVEGWTAATVSQRHVGWSSAILTQICLSELDLAEKIDSNWRREAIAPLVQCLPANLVQPIAAQAVAESKRGASMPLRDALLLACDFPWNEELSAAVIDFIQARLAAQNAVYDYSLRQLMTDVAAVRLAPTLAERLAERIASPLEHWSANFANVVHELVDTLRFRRDMSAALAPVTIPYSPPRIQ